MKEDCTRIHDPKISVLDKKTDHVIIFKLLNVEYVY